jgi:hypothetical protein
VKAATGDNPITGFQVVNHLPVLFGFFLLGADQQKIKDDKHQNQRNERRESSRTTWGASPPLSHSVSDIHWYQNLLSDIGILPAASRREGSP